MTRRTFPLLFTLTALAFTGCITKRSGNVEADDVSWQKGVTTPRDVTGAWGNPDAVHGNIWIWRETQHLGGKVKAAYYGIGVILSNMNTAHCEHRLHFDGKNRLARHEIVPSIPRSAEWGLLPW